MDQAAKKARVAHAALDYIDAGTIIGVGTGSTVDCFIDALAPLRDSIEAAVSSSNASTARLESHGITVVDLNDVDALDLYVDGADEVDPQLNLIKGGGGALTREKIVAAAARRFVCIVDDSKLVERLGAFPLPIEVIPLARNLVAREIVDIGGRPAWREGFVTDNGNQLLDVHGLDIVYPAELESELNQLAGVVTVGLFAQRGADVVLVADNDGVRTLER